MKAKSARRKPKRRHDSQCETYTLSEAKAYLGRLVNKSASGITIYIQTRGRLYTLQPVEQIEPIPIRPFGYFQYDAEDIALDRKFAAVNVVPRPDPE